MRMTFLGANHDVTGSRTLLEVNGRYILIDDGMEQGENDFASAPFPVAPGKIELVLLTHAHIDHTGMLPLLYKQGFRGAVYATAETCSLCNIMLKDSAHIQESEAEYQTRKAMRAGKPAVEPLYALTDVEGLLPLFHPCRYGERFPITEGVDVRFTDIGHLLGSAAIELWLKEGGVERKIVFSGDVGNRNQPIIKDPQAVDAADYLVSKGIPFRDCHEIIGKIVLHCINKGIAIEEMTMDEFKSFSPAFEEDIYEKIDIRNCIKAKKSKGSTSFESVKQQLADIEKQ